MTADAHRAPGEEPPLSLGVLGTADANEQVVEASESAEKTTDLEHLDPRQRVRGKHSAPIVGMLDHRSAG